MLGCRCTVLVLLKRFPPAVASPCMPGETCQLAASMSSTLSTLTAVILYSFACVVHPIKQLNVPGSVASAWHGPCIVAGNDSLVAWRLLIVELRAARMGSEQQVLTMTSSMLSSIKAGTEDQSAAC